MLKRFLRRRSALAAPFILPGLALAQVAPPTALRNSGGTVNLFDMGDGVGRGSSTSDTSALITALNACAANPGTTLFIPPGNFRFIPPSTGFLIPGTTTIQGGGQQKTVITWDDTLGFNLFASTGTSSVPVNDILLRDFTVQGSWQTNGNAATGGYPLLINSVNGLTYQNLTVEWSRIMSIVARGCTDVSALQCTVRYSGRDGINFAQCAGISIQNNVVEHTDDDAIAAHSNNIDPWGVRKNISIVGNRVFDCQGIKVLAARQTNISGNQLDCVRSQGISVLTVAASNQASPIEGVSAIQCLTITGNTITNCIKRNNIDNLNTGAPGIIIGAASARAGIYNAIPGEADHTNAVVIDPYRESFANSSSPTVPTMGGWGMVITGNTIARTLPSCNGTDSRFNRFSDFGFGQIFTRNGWQNPSLAEDDYRDNGIQLQGNLRDMLIEDNLIRGMITGIAFNTATRNDNIAFRGNSVIDTRDYGVLLNAGAGCLNRIYVENNVIDMDPFFKHANRGPNGTWIALGNPTCVQVQTGTGMIVRNNVFKNACRDSSSGTASLTSGLVWENNFAESDPTTIGAFSTSNKGFGIMQRAGGTRLLYTDCDPASATFGSYLGPSQNHAPVMPSTGKWLQGQVVWANQAGPVGLANQTLGWLRITTGTGNVLGTDWVALYCSTVAPITGWGAATNGSKAAFNGSTATLPQTSAALAQLIADLTTRGLIGP